MAEAHSAVAFSFSITHEGWDVNFDREVLHLVWASGVRSWKKRLARFKNNVRNGIFPAPLQSLWAMMGIVLALRYANNTFVKYTDFILKCLPGTSYVWQIVSCFILSLVFWLILIYIVRYTFKALLMYKGWMYESRAGKNVSLPTKLWVLGVKLLSSKSKPLLYSYQGSLPKLPLPPVNDTMQRYLKSIRPLMNDTEYNSMVKLANEFEKGIAVKLQRYLWLKSWWSSNYVSDWWEEYVYLRSRSPLIVNSNFYGTDAIMLHLTPIQAARAAMVIWQCLQYRRLIERQELEPIRVQGLVPLCSWQYERIFNTTRVPGAISDKIIHYNESRHIVVYHSGRYFKVIIYSQNRILHPCEIEVQIQSILDNKNEPYAGEEKVAALTAADRTHWANTRTRYFFKGINRQSLDAIEKAAFVVTLDEVPYEYDPENSTKLDEFGRILMTGKGYDRWFDKSFTLCIGSNGRVGFNAEHSWADAAVMSHLWEFIIFDEATKKGADAPVMGHLWEHFLCGDLVVGYQENGHTKGVPEFDPPKPIRLQWDLEPVLEAIEKSYQVALDILNDIDLRILAFADYGKGFMKTAKVSPDAFIQMALQLAYYKDAGKFSLTYEASMTRLYREGRTETVRPCTLQSSAWVKSMLETNVDLNERIRLLREACATHQRGYQDAMCGKGIDRHLFCLYVVSKYLEVESPFLNKVLSEPWRLSTSQTPHGQTNQFDLKKYPNCISAGGGFGPVANDGYGVSYIIAGENLIFFHISSKKNSLHTDSSRFAVRIKEALNDMRTLHEDWEKCMKKTKLIV